MGSYHTLDIEPGRDVKISKESWDRVSLEFLEEAAKSGKAEVGAVQFQDGLGFICSVTPSGVKILQRVEVAMPKKKLGSTSALEKAVDRFNTQLIDAVCQNINFVGMRAVVFAATGSAKDEFYKLFIEWLQKNEKKEILAHKSKIMRVNLPASAQLNPHNLMDILKEPRIAELLSDTKSANEVKLLDAFHKIHGSDDDGRVAFGLKQVVRAAKEGAVKDLLLADGLFRSFNVEERKRYGKLIGVVKDNGGNVMIFSPNSKADEELVKLSGVAAILNFAIDFD